MLYLSDKEVKILNLEKKRREYYSAFKSLQKAGMAKYKLKEIYLKYKAYDKRVNDIILDSSGLVKEEYDSVIKNNKLDVHMLKICDRVTA